MTVYIEYAFLQNFFLDGALLWLALKTSKTPVKWGSLTVSALFGAIFAVVYPLLKLTEGPGSALKAAVGVLLCMLAFGRLKTKREWRRFGLFTALFFALSFLFGGALLGLTQGNASDKIKAFVTPIAFSALSLFCVYWIRRLYKKRTVWQYIYDCTVVSGERSVKALGFFDSGNEATKNGIPVCFLSPEKAYELWGVDILFQGKGEGQVCDEIQIETMSGARKIPLYKGGLEIKTNGRTRRINEVYFAPSAHIISREYTMILHSRIFDEGEQL